MRSTGTCRRSACSTVTRAPLARWFPDGRLNTCHNALDRHVEGGRGDQPALIYDSPVTGTQRSYSYAELRDEVARLAGALRGLGVGRGRPRHPLPADGAAGAHGDAGLCAARRDPLGRLRRFRGARARGAHRRRTAARRALGLLRARGRAHDRVQAAARRRARGGRARAGALRDPAAPAARCGADAGPRPRLGRARRRCRARAVRAGARDRSALHPLHLGHDGPPQGRRARQRRPRRGARVEHAERLRRAPGRGLLGGLRRRLGRRPLLHRLRAAAHRRDHGAVRGQAGRHAGRGSILARDRAARSGGAVHGTDRDPGDPQGGPAGVAARRPRPADAAHALPGRRAHRSRHLRLGEPPPPAPRDRPLVADRDGLGDGGELPRPRPAARQGGIAEPPGPRLPHRRPRRRRRPRRAWGAGRHRGAAADAARHAARRSGTTTSAASRRISSATRAGT